MRVAQVLKTISGDASLPQLDYAALVAAGVVVPEFEDGAYADIVFDLGDSRCLQSRVSGAKLTPAGTPPTYGSGFLTIPSGGLNGLISPMPDPGSKTVAVIVKRPTNPTAAAIIAGSSEPAGGDDNGFFLCFLPTGIVTLVARKDGSDTAASISGSGSTGAVGDWLFVAMTETLLEGGGYNVSVLLGNGTSLSSASAAGVPRRTSATRNVAFGNAYNGMTNYAERALDIHRGLLVSKAMTAGELAALYQRSKILAARRGITVV